MSTASETMRNRLKIIDESVRCNQLDEMMDYVNSDRHDGTEHFYPVRYASFSDYSGCLVERANARALHDDDDLGEWIETVYGGHGTELHGFRHSNLMTMSGESFEALYEVLGALSDYPLLCEETHSEMELEAQNEAWESWAEWDYRKELESIFGDELIKDIPGDELYSMFRDAADAANEYWIDEVGGGAEINLERVAGATKLYARVTLNGYESNEAATSPPWDKRRVIRAGEIVEVQPATNLPDDSYIKYWVHPVDDNAEWKCDADGPYGVGLGYDDIERITYREDS